MGAISVLNMKMKENSKITIINLAWHIPEEIKNYMINLGIKNPLINIIEASDFK